MRTNLPPDSGDFKRDEVPLYNYPTISFFDQMSKEKAAAFKPGDEVRIHASASVRRKLSNITGAYFFDQRIVGDSIEKAPSIFKREFGVDERFGCDQYGIFRFKGEITKIIKIPGGISLNLATFIDRNVNSINVVMYRSNADKLLERFKPGDVITTVGHIQTVNKNLTDEKRITRVNYIAHSITKEEPTTDESEDK